MRACAKCGEEHELLDPTFRRPEAFVELDTHSQDAHAKANDDLCSIELPGEAARYFVRGTLPVPVEGHAEGVWWGLWAEISEAAFQRTLELWSDPNQATEPPYPGVLANVIPAYPNTLGLPLRVQLTGPTSRPEFRFASDAEHPFVHECRCGIDAHRATEWNELIDNAP